MRPTFINLVLLAKQKGFVTLKNTKREICEMLKLTHVDQNLFSLRIYAGYLGMKRAYKSPRDEILKFLDLQSDPKTIRELYNVSEQYNELRENFWKDCDEKLDQMKQEKFVLMES